MANTFKNIKIKVGDTATSTYDPSSVTGIIHALYISNITATDETVDIYLTEDAGVTRYHIMKGLEVPANSTIVLDKPINVLDTDTLFSIGSTNLSIEIVGSVMEIS